MVRAHSGTSCSKTRKAGFKCFGGFEHMPFLHIQYETAAIGFSLDAVSISMESVKTVLNWQFL
jgi:hypothetical protein